MSMPEDTVEVRIQRQLSTLTARLEGVSTVPNCGRLHPGSGSMFRVPEHVRATDPSAYEPKTVAIGPYHRDKPQVQCMNEVKLMYLSRILQRNSGMIPLGTYLQHACDLTAQSKSRYHGEINMEDDDFSDMLLLDGCFIIELLLTYNDAVNKDAAKKQQDLILDDMLTLSLVEFDMLLLENQLPFGVLERIFNLAVPRDEENPNSLSLVDISSKFFKGLIKDLDPLRHRPPTGMEFYHLLHLFHACFIGKPMREDQQNNSVGDPPTESMLMTPCASDLMKVGVKFRRKTARSFSWNISYGQGTVDISPARLNSISNSFYRNLITFEQYNFRNIRSRIMGYVMLMSCLIDSEKDLEFLRQHKIVAYTVDYREATLFFRKLCKDSVMDYDCSYLSQLQDQSMKVWDLYDTNWNRFIARAKRTLFTHPLNITYLIASAIFIVALTILQTVYTALAYYYK